MSRLKARLKKLEEIVHQKLATGPPRIIFREFGETDEQAFEKAGIDPDDDDNRLTVMICRWADASDTGYQYPTKHMPERANLPENRRSAIEGGVVKAETADSIDAILSDLEKDFSTEEIAAMVSGKMPIPDSTSGKNSRSEKPILDPRPVNYEIGRLFKSRGRR